MKGKICPFVFFRALIIHRLFLVVNCKNSKLTLQKRESFQILRKNRKLKDARGRARYLRPRRNRYAALQAARYLPACGQSIFARKVRAKEDFLYYMYREICGRCSRDFCSFGANIDLLIIPSSTVAATTVPLPHKDCFAIGERSVWMESTAARLTVIKARHNRAGKGRCLWRLQCSN